jgi:galactitol-1-phosphate 5-dehydrogenase
MKAVVLKAPYKVACEERPTPRLTADDQVIVKVLASGLCGQLHYLECDDMN